MTKTFGLLPAKTEFSHSWKGRFCRGLATVWKYRISAIILLSATIVLTAGYWLQALSRSLFYSGRVEVSQAIVIENFDPDYLLFERTEQLMREGWAERVFVPAQEGHLPGRVNSVSEGFVRVMARVAKMAEPEIIPIREIEPITLNAALQVRQYLEKRNIHSVIIVASGFRSRRSSMIWDSVLRPAGIKVCCVAVFGGRTPENWRQTWHGWQVVTEEIVKLAYYRLFVLPRIDRYSALPGRAY